MSKYEIIYADPPWEQKAGTIIPGYTVENGKQVWPKGNLISQALPYNTMNVQDICSLPIDNLSAENSVLFIWATNKHLPSVFRVIESWGFKYSTTLVWAKNMMGGGLGGTFKINTEFLLFCKKGNLPAVGSIKGTWHNVKRDYKDGYPNHSSKPEYFRKMVEKCFTGSKLELFARTQADGWDVFGNQVDNSIVIN